MRKPPFHPFAYGLIILYLFAFCLLSAFKGANLYQQQLIETIDLSTIALMDTFTNTLSPISPTRQQTAAFHPMYIGKYTHNIPLSYSSRALRHHRTRDWLTYPNPDSLDLQLFVDTSKIIGSVQALIQYPAPSTTEETYFPPYIRGAVRSYPIFILNQSKDTMDMGIGEHLPLIIEAQDRTGVWKPIQKVHYYHCGTGLTRFYLPANELILSSYPVFEGAFETVLRVKHAWSKGNYSNTFPGKINYSLFKKEENVWSY
ncbi:MAG: hypothetical protein ACRBFS_10730 [Aureispira sp.]